MQEALPVFLIHIPLTILGKSCMVREVHSYRGLVRITRVCPIADSIVRVYKQVPAETPETKARVFSKLKLVAALK